MRASKSFESKQHSTSHLSIIQRIKHFRKRLFRKHIRGNELRQLIEEMLPEWPHDVVRIGGEEDGGYIIPNDLEGIAYCFSPGVGPSARFELELQQRFGIASFLADYTVDCPEGIDPAFFTKAFVGHKSKDDRFIDFTEWVESNAGNTQQDMILQMDIEGGEYDVLGNVAPELLKRFRIIIVEFHGLDRLFDRRRFTPFATAIRNLMTHFRVVHIHPNNNGPIGLVGEIECPSLLEITFARRDRIYEVAERPTVPHPLDRQNVRGPELVLPEHWRGRATA